MSAEPEADSPDPERRIVAGSRAFRTVRQLCDAAIEVFEDSGFHQAQVADIAERAGVSRATFYNYFASKEELLRHMVMEAFPSLLNSDQTGPNESRWEKLRVSTESYLVAYRRHATLMHVWSEAAARNEEMAGLLRDLREPFLARTEQSILRQQQEGVLSSRIDANYAAYALTGMVTSLAYTWFVEGYDFEWDRAVETVSALWAAAVGVETPVEER